jgi:signal recognition particle subunit SRP54
MFENLSERLAAIFKKLRGRGKLSEQDVGDVLREVRMALLEADVNLQVARDFIKKVKERAVGEAIWDSLTPAQQVIKFVRDELIELMGSSNEKLTIASQPPTIIMMVGLHGSGKTTTTAKLALHLKEKGHRPIMAATDVYRPAAITQLQVLGSQIEVPVFSLGDRQTPLNICLGALGQASREGRDILLIDTAGRLHIDEELMRELGEIKEKIRPTEVLLVVDAMIGQDSVQMAEQFNRSVGIDGLVLTKLDGDARGGAALSIKSVTGKPVKFVGVGEKLTALEPFHPDRMAGRILGMGDVLTLIEKAETAFDAQKAQELEQKIREQSFTLEDFLDQLRQLRKMGPLEQILGMMPGFSQAKGLKDLRVDEKEMAHIEAIICSMTKEERCNPGLLNSSRRRRIAAGSGLEVSDINRLVKQYDMVKKMMKQFADFDRPGKGGRKKMMKIPFWG